jgi:hypothetical protein
MTIDAADYTVSMRCEERDDRHGVVLSYWLLIEIPAIACVIAAGIAGMEGIHPLTIDSVTGAHRDIQYRRRRWQHDEMKCL